MKFITQSIENPVNKSLLKSKLNSCNNSACDWITDQNKSKQIDNLKSQSVRMSHSLN